MTTTDVPPTKMIAVPNTKPSAGTTPPPLATRQTPPNPAPSVGDQDDPEGHDRSDAQPGRALGANAVPPTKHIALPTGLPSAGNQLPGGHCSSDAHTGSASGNTTPPPSHITGDPQAGTAGRGPILADRVLGLLAASVDDLEGTRKSLANRYRQLTRAESDSDGHQRGFGLTDLDPAVMQIRVLLAAIAGEKLDGSGGIEHQAVLNLGRQMRKHDLWKAWAKNQKGIGEKQFARLLAAIGDPYWNDLYDRPRTVSELWAYAGLHVVHPADQPENDAQGDVVGGVAPKRARGQKANWSDEARMRVWNIAGSCLKARGDYGDVYYRAKGKYAEAVHPAPCVRCGPAGKPAQVGSPLSDGHKHARALRIVSKEILKDLWRAARALHERAQTPAADHQRFDTHGSHVGDGFNVHTDDHDGTVAAILMQDWAALSPELIS
jgi:hypothetical protein